MTRHILDHHTVQTGSRTRNFLRIAREAEAEGPHPSSRAVFERPASREEATKVREYARIERGITT